MCYRYLRADSSNNKMNLHPKNKIRQGIFFFKKNLTQTWIGKHDLGIDGLLILIDISLSLTFVYLYCH